MKDIKFTKDQVLFLNKAGMLDPFGIRDFIDSPAWQLEFWLKNKKNPVVNRNYCRLEMIEWDKAVAEGAGNKLESMAIPYEKEEIAEGDEWKVAAGLEKPPSHSFDFDKAEMTGEMSIGMGESDYDKTSAKVGLDIFDKSTKKWHNQLYTFDTHDEAREWMEENDFEEVHDYWGCGTNTPKDEHGEHNSWQYYWDLEHLKIITDYPLVIE